MKVETRPRVSYERGNCATAVVSPLRPRELVQKLKLDRSMKGWDSLVQTEPTRLWVHKRATLKEDVASIDLPLPQRPHLSLDDDLENPVRCKCCT